MVQALSSEAFLIQASKALQTSLLKSSAEFSPHQFFYTAWTLQLMVHP